MDTDNVRLFNKPTFIYGLVDPRTDQLRYVGKTVLSPERRLGTHLWAARKDGPKRHAHAWLRSVLDNGAEPEIVLLETVDPLGDWVEAEEFWIGYFKFVGSDLCNLTTGGEGRAGHKETAEQTARRVVRGERHGNYGKSMPGKTKAAIKAGNERLRADPVRWKRACDNRVANRPADQIEKLHAGRDAARADPVKNAEWEANRSAAMRRPEVRAKISDNTRALWVEKRDEIIAAQNVGKGVEWREKHSQLGRERLANDNHPLRVSAIKRRKLSDDDVINIRQALANGERQKDIANRYDVSSSLISHIKSGSKR